MNEKQVLAKAKAYGVSKASPHRIITGIRHIYNSAVNTRNRMRSDGTFVPHPHWFDSLIRQTRELKGLVNNRDIIQDLNHVEKALTESMRAAVGFSQVTAGKKLNEVAFYAKSAMKEAAKHPRPR